MDEVELTEMYDIKVTRQDGVRSPASGVPFLVMKSVAAEAAPTETEPATVPEPTIQKSAPEGAPPTQTPAATEPQASPDVLTQDAVLKMIDARVAEVTQDAEGRIKALADELAVLKDTPIPGGPALTATAAVQADKSKADAIEKATYFERKAEMATDHETVRYYRAKAEAARAAAL